MNPRFKWLLIGTGALALLLVLLAALASCQAVRNAERRAQELEAQLADAQSAAPVPTLTPSPPQSSSPRRRQVPLNRSCLLHRPRKNRSPLLSR